MHRLLITLLLCSTALMACDGPRGGAISDDIIKEAQDENSPYQIILVDRKNSAAIAHWPRTGGGLTGWLSTPIPSGSPKGPLIQSGDLLDLVIWDSAPNSLLTSLEQKAVPLHKMQVSPSGAVFIPYIGEVMVRGLSPSEARAKVQELLASVAPAAQVQLEFAQGINNSVDLVGGVAQPGSYPVRDSNQTLLSMIARSGGISPQLRNPVVRLMRGGRSYEVYADDLLSSARYNVVVQPGDQLVVEKDDRYFTAIGATGGAEKLIEFGKPQVTVLEAISMMGGLSDHRADPKGVMVLRDYPHTALRRDGTGPLKEQVVFVFNIADADGLFAARNFLIHPKDTVLATESRVASTRSTIALVASMVSLGNNLSN